jgi:tricorn protease-like protein
MACTQKCKVNFCTATTLTTSPNPFSNTTNIQLSKAVCNNYTLTITDINGAKIKTINKVRHNSILDMSAQANGQYIAQISNGKDSAQVKIVKQ